jgi:hypothetical protein
MNKKSTTLANLFLCLLALFTFQYSSFSQRVPLTASQDSQNQENINYIEGEMEKLRLKFKDMKEKGETDFPESLYQNHSK